jgi:redox-sensitive bicupin YhaK (pirin superfamily)
MEPGTALSYTIQMNGNGLYAFLIEGAVTINNQHQLGKRDALGIWDINELHVQATEEAQLLLMELPMVF